MQLIRRFRLPAVFCALALLVCELVSRPYADMGICDDGPYILVAQTLAATGHIVYNGWSEAMLGWQLYLGAAFIKLFGFSITTVRMSILLVAMLLAFVLQRTMVRANISERNAVIGTLALVLSPLYLVLSVTFMTDITGLLGIVLCLYGCVRALQASTSNRAIGWLYFSVLTNAICGTSRQIAWLGILVMVPSTIWLLRARRRVFLAGAAATVAGVGFIFYCMHWYKQQPMTEHTSLFVSTFSVVHTVGRSMHAFLDAPFLLLPIVALFIPEIRKSRSRFVGVTAAFLSVYLFLALYPSHLRVTFPLEPTIGDWLSVYGIFQIPLLKGTPPLFLHRGVQLLLTIVSFGGLLGLIASLGSTRKESSVTGSRTGISWKELSVIVAPFSIAYILLLLSRAAIVQVVDRYTLGVLVVGAICLVRYYQDRINPRLPIASIILIGVMAVYGIAQTHNQFALYRARVAMADEIRSAGIPDTSVDNGWEYNLVVELQHSDHINEVSISPATMYVPAPPLAPGTCEMPSSDRTPHIRPVYGVSFDPDACYGPAPFAPVKYSRWLAASPGTLYVVRYTAQSKH